MIFGLVTFAKVELHPLISIMRSAIHRIMTCLIFLHEVGKLGGNMWVWGANQLVLWVFYNEKTIRQHFILHVTTLETWQNHVLAFNLIFIEQMTHVEFANNVVHLTNFER